MELFGLEHILYMVVASIIMALLLFVLIRFVPHKKIYIPLKVFATVGFVIMIVYRIVVAKSRNSTFKDFLPDTFCSMMGFIMPIVILCFKPKTKIYQYAMFCGMIGGLLTFIYPDFIVYFDNIFNIHPFLGLLYHTNMLFMFLLAIISKYFVPTFKNWTALPIGLAFMVVIAVFGNNVLNQSNNMYLNAPLISGTPLTWYLVGILFIILYTIILQIYEMFTLKKCDWTIVKFIRYIKNKIIYKHNKSNLKTRKKFILKNSIDKTYNKKFIRK